LVLFSIIVSFAACPDGSSNQTLSIPDDVAAMLKKQSLDKRLEVWFRIDSFYLRGDFDGDKKPDIAVLVKDKQTGKLGIAISHSSSGKVFVIGAGTNLSNGGDNFDWADTWKMYPKNNPDKIRGLILKGDALIVTKSESGGGLIYWNGTR
jgi:hypothetical protein